MSNLPFLTEANFILYASASYCNPSFTTAEFYEDLNHFKYLKRLLNQYKATGELKDRHIMNHIVILYNVFGREATTRMLFLKLKGLESYFIPFLVLLGVLPETVLKIGETSVIFTSDFGLDQRVIDTLRKI